MARSSIPQRRTLPTSLPLFDGFPYLSVRVVGAMRHLTLLPVDWPADQLDALGRRQVAANRLPACLVLSPDRALAYDAAGDVGRATPQPPRGGLLVAGHLEPPVPVPASDELQARADRLAAFLADTQPHTGQAFGDLTKGGRPATPDERVCLQGRQREGVPRGLARCSVCQRWAGVCLDPSPVFHGQVMRVDCACANDNHCARCGDQLADWKLNANSYAEQEDQIWHVPGFVAFDHRCATPADRQPRGPEPTP
jgi:hypothetical protein